MQMQKLRVEPASSLDASASTFYFWLFTFDFILHCSFVFLRALGGQSFLSLCGSIPASFTGFGKSVTMQS